MDGGRRDGGRDRDEVACAGEAPDAPVDAERDDDRAGEDEWPVEHGADLVHERERIDAARVTAGSPSLFSFRHSLTPFP